MKRKFWSVLLAVLIVALVGFSGLAPEASAEVWDGYSSEPFAGGSGTAEDPYQIANGKQLYYLSQMSCFNAYHSAAYILTADIDLGNRVFPSIPTFEGTLDGDGRTIYNLNIYESGSAVGFIGRSKNCTIKNLTLSGSVTNICGSNTGAFIGEFGYYYGGKGKIENCHNYCSVTSNSNETGGFAGYMSDSSIIINCSNHATIQGTDRVGGFVGFMESSAAIINSSNHATIQGANCVGGFVGEVSQSSGESVSPNISIDTCCNYGDVEGNLNVGGLVGFQLGSTIQHAFNIGNISGSCNIGGIVGSSRSCMAEYDGQAGFFRYYHSSYINDCYNTGMVTCYDNIENPDSWPFYSYYAGGIAGYFNSNYYGAENGDNYIIEYYPSEEGGISRCYNTGIVTTCAYKGGGGICDQIGLPVNNCYWLAGTCEGSDDYGLEYSHDMMADINSYPDFDFENTWAFAQAGDYPYPTLRNFTHPTITFCNEDGTVLSQKVYHLGATAIAPEDPCKEADENYFYHFAGWDETPGICTGDKVYTATYTAVPKVAITNQYAIDSAYTGHKVVVSVDALGDGLTYQWFCKNAEDSDFACADIFTGSIYTTTMTNKNNGQQVYCLITDKYGNTTTTKTYTLTMRTMLTISEQPANVSAPAGTKAQVTFSAVGDGLTYKWYYASKGASKFTLTNTFTSNTYAVTMNSTRDGRRIYCVVSDKYGNSLATDIVTLSQYTPLTITQQPVCVSVASGQQAKVTVAAQGDGLRYTWYYAAPGSNVFTKTSFFTTGSYYVSMNEARNGRQVYCVITDQYGNSVTSETVTLRMYTPLKITSQPVSAYALPGTSVRVSVGVQGDGLTYQWYYANAGETEFKLTTAFRSNSYTITMNDTRAGRRLYCVITDQYGNSVTTAIVTIGIATE